MNGSGKISTWSRVLHKSVDWLLPLRCMGCPAVVDQPATFCGRCWSALHFIEKPFCPVTGDPFPYEDRAGMVSAAALAHAPAYTAARAPLRYNETAGRLVSRIKYGDRLDLVKPVARLMARAGRELLGQTDVVLPVPLHYRRRIRRRFNQAGELAREVARLGGCAFDPRVLRRVRPTRAQVGLSRPARLRNVAGAFELDPGRRTEVAGCRVMVIDDVLTSGATVNACARILEREGARAVYVLTIARVVDTDALTL